MPTIKELAHRAQWATRTIARSARAIGREAFAGLGVSAPPSLHERSASSASTRLDRSKRTQMLPPTIRTLTIDDIKIIISQHERGEFNASALLADRLMRNSRIATAIQTRELGVQGLPFEILPSDADKRRGKTIASKCEKAWTQIAAKDSASELLRSKFLGGIGFARIIWDTSGPEWIPTLEPWHSMWFRWDAQLERYTVQTLEGLVVIEPNDGNWFVLGDTRYHAWMRGIVRSLGLTDKSRGDAVRDWNRWSELHGLPPRKALVPSSGSTPDKDRFFADISALGNETTLLLPRGATEQDSFDLQFAELKDQSWDGFQALVALCDADVSIAILGQNLTTEVAGGSLAAAKVHDKVRQDYLEADAETLSRAFHEQVLRPWAALNFGDADLAPTPFWDPEAPEDKSVKATAIKTAGEGLSAWLKTRANVDIEAYAQEFGVPLVKGQPLLPEPEPAAIPDPNAAPATPPNETP